MERNRDYTLEIRDVKPEHQSNIATALQAMANAIGMVYRTDFSSRYSPAVGRWVVEYWSNYSKGWHRSVNLSTIEEFGTREEAQKVADAQTDGFKYHVRDLNAPEETWIVEHESSAKKEQWVVQARFDSGWRKSGSITGTYSNREEANAAIDNAFADPTKRHVLVERHEYRVHKVE